MEKTTQVIASSIVALVILAFVYLGFFDEQICDIDKQYLWCRLHPFTTLDLIGCILFGIGASIIGGLPKLFGYDPVAWDGNWRTWVTILITVAGIVLIWLD